MDPVMFSEINQALETVRRKGGLALKDWPKNAEVSPAEVGLIELDGRLVRELPVDSMDAQRLQQQAQALGLKLAVESYSVIDSTNRQLMQRARSETISGTLLTCDYQWSGRGRRGRHWISPFARNLAFSYAHSSGKALHQLGGLSCVVGLAIVDVLSDLGVVNPALKWPNDVWIKGNKLAGILVELASLGTSTQAVIGVGLNMALRPEDKAKIDQPVIDLRTCGVDIDRNSLLMELVKKLLAYLEHFESKGFVPFMDAFDAVHALHQQAVVIRTTGTKEPTETYARALGVGPSGQLMIEGQNGTEELLGGEVSLRPALTND